MPRAKRYAGRRVINRRYGNKIMHMADWYIRYNRKLGIYSDAYDTLVKVLAARIKNKQENVILIEGEVGSGKSTLAIQIAMDLAKALGKTFDMERDYVYNLDALWKKLDALEKDDAPISWFDEGSVALNSLDSRSRGAQDVNAILDTCRDHGITTIICCPSYRNVNKSIIRNHVTYKLECTPPTGSFIPDYGRGGFEVTDRRFSKKQRYNPDPYWNVLYTGIFLPLDSELEKKYKLIKAKHQKENNARIKARHMKDYVSPAMETVVTA